ncbi:hypothetical protein F4860DRAFT_525747 [Xylaria cubensis]|nr:hypothetical protein F4860DRAFT_525747 [Xylaria cubensis]
MVGPQPLLILGLLGLAVPVVLAGGCFSSVRDPDGDPTIPNNDKWAECKNPVPPPGGWACTNRNLAFPDLECIIAELKACGDIGAGATIFYSMGATTVEVRQGFRDQLSPKGIMFNDALGSQWWKALQKERPDFNLVGQQARQDYLRNLFAIAMAQASSGEVFLATKSRVSEADIPGDPGIFQNPTRLPNIWRQMELPNLQRNAAITAITHVDVSNNYQRTIDWRQGDGNIFPLPDIDPNNPPAVVKRQDAVTDSCPLPPFPSEIPTSVISTQLSSITPVPTVSCELQNQDPNQGITQAYCLCNGSITLTPLPATKTCTTVASCTPTATPVSIIAAWVGNLSTVNIGNAEDGNGGMDLAREMFTKLKGMCNSGSGCVSDHAEMDNVETVILDGEQPLKPAMYLQDAQYSSQAVLEKMLSVGIASWISVLNNEDLMLCKEVEYEADADETGSGCGQGPIHSSRLRRKVHRDTGELLWERRGLVEERNLTERCVDNCDHPLVCHYQARMCSAPNEITVVMAGDGGPYTNHLNIGVTLDKIDDGFPCEEVAEAITAALAVLAPELLGADAFEGVELEAICGVLEDPASIVGHLR